MDVLRVQATHTTIAVLAEHFFREARDPAALLFVESLEEQVQLFMQPLLGEIGITETNRALALMNRVVVHAQRA
jgi:hypothetical protein